MHQIDSVALVRIDMYFESFFVTNPADQPFQHPTLLPVDDQPHKIARADAVVLGLGRAHMHVASDPDHQGLLLHAVYHRPNAWDNVPADALVPCGESCMWGDYHIREAALYVQRLASEGPYLAFFGPERP